MDILQKDLCPHPLTLNTIPTLTQSLTLSLSLTLNFSNPKPNPDCKHNHNLKSNPTQKFKIGGVRADILPILS